MVKIILATIFVIPVLCLAGENKAAGSFIPAFQLNKNDLEISRLAQTSQYFDKIGQRAGLMGYEDGSFEMWVWPWKPLRNFELSFLLGTSTQPILARDIVRTISVTPEATVLTYTYESFTVKEIIYVPRSSPGAIILLEINSTVPLTVVSSFMPVMQPMWPAGVGGQFSYWDEEAGAYIISEGQWRAVFLCGSPAAQQMAAPPAHMFADNPLQFKIDVTPGDSRGKYVPIIIAGGEGMKVDSAKAVFRNLWKNASQYYIENYNYFRSLRKGTIALSTPDEEFNLAFEWGKVALDNLMVTSPRLGRGLVAGYGLSGGGARPGFAWFFGGDAFINSLALDSYCGFQTVRDALEFTQKWQRQEDYPVKKKKAGDVNKDIGKMAHELSQSDGLCDWWNDYHYGYNHADTTPWYLVAMGDYVRTSGDVAFLKKSYSSVKQAYQWCLRKDSDGDGLMDLKGSGLGALEFGKLVGIYADVYTCGVWVQAVKEMIMMAELAGDSETKSQAGSQYEKAREALDRKFWVESRHVYSYGVTEKGEQVSEKTAWPGLAMMFGLLDEKKTYQCLDILSGADICTDWGVRSLARSSELFEPTNYNYGAVWPFISSFFNTAQFIHGHELAGYSVLKAVASHAFDNAIGCVPEVFSGELNQKLAEGYHHQGFSTTGYMLPLVRGLLGLELNALEKKISLNPHLPPDWHRVSVSNVQLGHTAYDFIIRSGDSSVSLTVSSEDAQGRFTLRYSPNLPPGYIVSGIFRNGKVIQAEKSSGGEKFELLIKEARSGDELTVNYTPTAAVIPPQLVPKAGATSSSLKLVSQKLSLADQKRLCILMEGVSGETYAVHLLKPELIAAVEGGSIQGGILNVTFQNSDKKGFVQKEIFITLK